MSRPADGRPRSRPRTRRRILVGAAVLALSAALWGFSGRLGGVDAAGNWAEVHREDLILGVEATGTLEAVDAALLGPPPVPDQWNHKISFLAPEGMEVAAGTPVVRFDTSELENKLVEKMAEAESAREEYEKKAASLESARRDEELQMAETEARRRKSALKVDVPAELVAANELTQARADLALAEKEITYRRARLASTRRQGETELGALARRRDRAAARVAEIRGHIASMTVRAPRAGTVVYVTDRGSEKKKVGDSVWQAEKVVEIPDLRRMRAEVEVDESDAGRVAVGQPMTLRLDAHPDLAFTGRVKEIRRAIKERSDVNGQKVVELTVELDSTDPQRMRPGMRLRGLVETSRVPGVLVVPAEAVEATAAGPVVHRRTAFGGTALVRPRLGQRNERWVQVLGGLAEGDQVARAGAAAMAGAGGAA